MAIDAVLFDLDGTLLPMDQDLFVQTYLQKMCVKLTHHGFDPKKLAKSIWFGTDAMLKNDGSVNNEQRFWDAFSAAYGQDMQVHAPLFDEYYRNEFSTVRSVCGFTAESAKLVHRLQDMGITVILATNPLFPAVATNQRIAWAGLTPEDFALVTTFENSSYCKPNLKYYEAILEQFGLDPHNCLMVGNDVSDDMPAANTGMQVFLLTDCLINTKHADTTPYPQGSFAELNAYIDANL